MIDPTYVLANYHTASKKDAEDYLEAWDCRPGDRAARVEQYTKERLYQDMGKHTPPVACLLDWALRQVDWYEVTRRVSNYTEIQVKESFATVQELGDYGEALYRVYVRTNSKLFLFRTISSVDSTAEYIDPRDLAAFTSHHIVEQWIPVCALVEVEEITGEIIEHCIGEAADKR